MAQHDTAPTRDAFAQSAPPPANAFRRGPRNQEAYGTSLDDAARMRTRRRSVSARLVGVGVEGWLRLAGLSLAVGVVVEAAGFNPLAPHFVWAEAVQQLGQAALGVLAWSVAHGWRPLLIGALFVGPLWLGWRVITLPFRR